MLLGCGFEARAANPVDDDMDAPNSHTCRAWSSR
jgi:hypothetical protein